MRDHARRGRHGTRLEDRRARRAIHGYNQCSGRSPAIGTGEASTAPGWPRETGTECMDPHDPPADIGVQMHVYLMLHRFDPPAARALCKAILRWSGKDEVWVYYAKTALVPYLRSAELDQLGCPVPLPTARLARPVPGQEWWSEAARLLVQTGASAPDPSARQAIHGPSGAARRPRLRSGRDWLRHCSSISRT